MSGLEQPRPLRLFFDLPPGAAALPMGRLPTCQGQDVTASTTGAGSRTCGLPVCGQEQVDGQACRKTLAERLEEWRCDPDMCLVWAAFCTNSALTLSDGLRIAKTCRAPSAVLQLLSGGSDEGPRPAAGPDAVAPAASAKVASFERAGADAVGGGGLLGGFFDTETATEAPTSAPASPSQAPFSAPSSPSQGPSSLPSPATGAVASPLFVPQVALAAGRAAEAAGQLEFELVTAAVCSPSPRASGTACASQAAREAARCTTPVAKAPADSPVEATPPPPQLAAPRRGRVHESSAAERDPRDTDITYFRRIVEAPFKPWASSPFAASGQGHRLAKSVHGEVRLLDSVNSSSSSSVSLCGGFTAVAKVIPNESVERSRMQEANERRSWLSEGDTPPIEDLLNEVAVLTYLQQSSLENSPFIIRIMGAFQDSTSSFMVTEYCEGGELFERVAYGDPLGEAEKKRYISQLLQAVQHLHGRNVGHRDISLENVLLRNGDCVLMDFGQAVRLRSIDGTPLRYFAEAGKRMYRSPEMYVPRQKSIQVVCPSDAKPGTVAQVSYDKCRCEVMIPEGAVPGQPCSAEPYGYAAAPSDIFACGVCAFVLTVGKPPWAVARDADPTFSFVRRHGVPMLLKQWRGGAARAASAGEEESLLAQLLRTEPGRRPDIEECLRAPWLSSVVPPRFRSQTN